MILSFSILLIFLYILQYLFISRSLNSALVHWPFRIWLDLAQTSYCDCRCLQSVHSVAMVTVLQVVTLRLLASHIILCRCLDYSWDFLTSGTEECTFGSPPHVNVFQGSFFWSRVSYVSYETVPLRDIFFRTFLWKAASASSVRPHMVGATSPIIY